MSLYFKTQLQAWDLRLTFISPKVFKLLNALEYIFVPKKLRILNR